MRLLNFLPWRDSHDQIARQIATRAIVAKAKASDVEQQLDSWPGPVDPMVPASREFQELSNARDEARIAAEEARHALARHLHPRGYARKGYPGRSVERFLARAEREAEMHTVRPDKMYPVRPVLSWCEGDVTQPDLEDQFSEPGEASNPTPGFRNTAEPSGELSKGDVVVVGEVALADAGVGWTPLRGGLAEVRASEHGTRPLPGRGEG